MKEVRLVFKFIEFRVGVGFLGFVFLIRFGVIDGWRVVNYLIVVFDGLLILL